MGPWLSIRAARRESGLRLLLLRGLPSPWSLAARAVFDVKRVPYLPVEHAPEDEADAVRAWTRQSSLPAAMLDDERPRTGWMEILLLAERMAPDPALVPEDPALRAHALGLANELCGELGLAWCRRLVGLEPRLLEVPREPRVAAYLRRYGSPNLDAAHARARMVGILELLGNELDRQRARGSAWLVGDALSAVDLYWATFSNVVEPLSPERMALPDEVRRGFKVDDPDVRAAFTPALRAHRDRIYSDHLPLPVEV